jgi:hypothetical protein
MTATIGSTPFELVDESTVRTPEYQGVERRRTRPRVAVCDRLAQARRIAWTVTGLRIALVIALWTLLAAPHLMEPGLVAVRTGVPLVYILTELIGLATVLRQHARLAQAATLY